MKSFLFLWPVEAFIIAAAELHFRKGGSSKGEDQHVLFDPLQDYSFIQQTSDQTRYSPFNS